MFHRQVSHHSVSSYTIRYAVSGDLNRPSEMSNIHMHTTKGRGREVNSYIDDRYLKIGSEQVMMGTSWP